MRQFIEKYGIIITLIIIFVAFFIFMVETDGTPGEKQALQPQTLTVPELAAVLKAAVNDVKAQGYEPMFFDDAHALIWVRDLATGDMRVYRLNGIIDRYLETREKSKEGKKDENN